MTGALITSMKRDSQEGSTAWWLKNWRFRQQMQQILYIYIITHVYVYIYEVEKAR